MTIEPKECPICKRGTNYVYNIKEHKGGESLWYQCPCGIIFQKEFNPNHKEEDLEDTENNQRHGVKIYAPLIEELTYGRQVLQVGYTRSPETLKELEKRGWLVWGIDKEGEGKDNLYKGDIFLYPFTPSIQDNEIKEELKEEKRLFDLIWVQYSLERQYDPLGYLRKIYDLLAPTGVLYLSTPNIDTIFRQGVANWAHWQKDDNNILFSKRALVREVEKVGFKVIMSRDNSSVRFMGHSDIHLIAQKLIQ
jgi:SAM-dependent methyltransferase